MEICDVHCFILITVKSNLSYLKKRMGWNTDVSKNKHSCADLEGSRGEFHFFFLNSQIKICLGPPWKTHEKMSWFAHDAYLIFLWYDHEYIYDKTHFDLYCIGIYLTQCKRNVMTICKVVKVNKFSKKSSLQSHARFSTFITNFN